MRLLYQYAIGDISKKNCRVIIRSLKSRVASGFDNSPTNVTPSQIQLPDVIYKFITTSRKVEVWLQEREDDINKMGRGKVSPELWMVIGSNGAGKSHIKEYLTRKKISGVDLLELEMANLLPSTLNRASTVEDFFSLILLRTRNNLDVLFTSIVAKENPLSTRDSYVVVKEILKEYFVDDIFINMLCDYEQLRIKNQVDFSLIENFIMNNGSQIYTPLMRLYKKYLGVNGVCIFIDELEDLQHLPLDKQGRFVESIRSFYDSMASTLIDPNSPAYKIIILCTLSFWNEIISDTRSRALETRVHFFEIPPLLPDEIIEIGEKLFLVFKKSGLLNHNLPINFYQLPSYLLSIAKIEHPLTPRFVIEHIINIIEDPSEYIKFVQ